MDAIQKCPVCNSKKLNSKSNTCSRQCADELKKINSREERICLECQTPFIVRKKIENKLCSDNCRKLWGLRPENKLKRLQKATEAIENKYGVKTTLQLKEVKEKIKQTKKEKYGDENYNNHQKATETNLEKYGSKHILSVSKIRDHGKKTKKEKYGDENFNNREKAKQTSQDLFGVDHAMKLDSFKNKQQNTNLEKYGEKFPLQNKEISLKKDETNFKKYGFKNPSQNEEIKQKIKFSYYKKFPESLLFDKLKLNNVSLLSKYEGIRIGNNHNNYEFKCNNCSTKFEGTFTNNRPPICRICYPIFKNNKIHSELREFLLECELNNLFIENTKQIIKPFELDFYIPTLKVAIELNGNYYHSEIKGEKDRNYHINKTKLCFEQNIRLIHVFEDEWIFQKDIVKSKIQNILNLNKQKIYARKCEIKLVSSKDKILFLEQNHLQGDAIDEIRIGLYYQNELISIITFLKLRNWLGDYKKSSKSWELVRFCNKANINIPGGFSKLLKYFIKNYDPNFILTFADCRWSSLDYNNTVYVKNDFEFIKFTPPSYFYFKKGDYLHRFHRFTFNKKKLLKLFDDKNLNNSFTEWELAQKLEMDRIWDCGNIRFEWNKKKEV